MINNVGPSISFIKLDNIVSLEWLSREMQTIVNLTSFIFTFMFTVCLTSKSWWHCRLTSPPPIRTLCMRTCLWSNGSIHGHPAETILGPQPRSRSSSITTLRELSLLSMNLRLVSCCCWQCLFSLGVFKIALKM